MNYSRIDRVGELLKHEIAEIIDRELDNPNLPDFITVERVKVSKDLQNATVRVTLLADSSEDEVKRTIRELNKAAGYISRLVAQRTELRRHPSLRFVYNPSTKYALDMEKIFQQIKKEPPVELPDDDTTDPDE